MRLSCCAYSYRDLLTSGKMTLEGFLATCARLGFDGVELTQYYFPEETDAYLNHIKREAFRLGLDVSGSAVGGGFASADAKARLRQIEHVCDWLKKSARLGSPMLRVFAGRRPKGVDFDTAAEWVRDGLARCAEVAAACGVVLALENHGGATATAGEALSLIEPFEDNPWVGLNLDFGNFTGDVYEQFARCAPHAVTTHAKVTTQQDDRREPVDYHRVVRIMRDAGYAGYLAIEYEEPDDPVAGVERFAAYLWQCLGTG